MAVVTIDPNKKPQVGEKPVSESQSSETLRGVGTDPNPSAARMAAESGQPRYSGPPTVATRDKRELEREAYRASGVSGAVVGSVAEKGLGDAAPVTAEASEAGSVRSDSSPEADGPASATTEGYFETELTIGQIEQTQKQLKWYFTGKLQEMAKNDPGRAKMEEQLARLDKDMKNGVTGGSVTIELFEEYKADLSAKRGAYDPEVSNDAAMNELSKVAPPKPLTAEAQMNVEREAAERTNAAKQAARGGEPTFGDRAAVAIENGAYEAGVALNNVGKAVGDFFGDLGKKKKPETPKPNDAPAPMKAPQAQAAKPAAPVKPQALEPLQEVPVSPPLPSTGSQQKALPETQILNDGTLQFGDQGRDVSILQVKLGMLGRDIGEADGIYGRKTREAIRDIQKKRGEDLEAQGKPNPYRKSDGIVYYDGIAGPEELTYIDQTVNNDPQVRKTFGPNVVDTLNGKEPSAPESTPQPTAPATQKSPPPQQPAPPTTPAPVKSLPPAVTKAAAAEPSAPAPSNNSDGNNKVRAITLLRALDTLNGKKPRDEFPEDNLVKAALSEANAYLAATEDKNLAAQKDQPITSLDDKRLDYIRNIAVTRSTQKQMATTEPLSEPQKAISDRASALAEEAYAEELAPPPKGLDDKAAEVVEDVRGFFSRLLSPKPPKANAAAIPPGKPNAPEALPAVPREPEPPLPPVERDANGKPVLRDANGNPIGKPSGGSPSVKKETPNVVVYDARGNPMIVPSNEGIQVAADGEPSSQDVPNKKQPGRVRVGV